MATFASTHIIVVIPLVLPSSRLDTPHILYLFNVKLLSPALPLEGSQPLEGLLNVPIVQHGTHR
jgi:hypothetical protein